jgi:uncharacterized protein (DUF2141 family)
MRGRRLAALAAGALLVGGAAPVARLDVAVDHLRSAKGTLRLCLTARPESFPSCVDDAQATVRSVPAGAGTIRVDGLPRGAYALALIHDENSNARLDTLAGIPREGFGFSNNPPIGFGPPRFASARFSLAGDAGMQQVRMRYLL